MQAGQVARDERLKQVQRARALQGDHAQVAPMVDADLGRVEAALVDDRPQPSQIGLGRGAVDHQQHALLEVLIDQQVVNDAAVGPAHARVKDLAGLAQAAQVVGQDDLEEFDGARAPRGDHAHVADVKDAGALAHRGVFLARRGELDRQGPAAELDHLGAARQVTAVKRCLFHG
jgi:hypothetical protein